MGTTGTGRLTDYSGGGGGGGDDDDRCGEAFDELLEEVARSPYFQNQGQLPPVGEEVHVRYQNSRLAAIATSTGEVIGYLPTSRNYLRDCIENQGQSYSGAVVFARMPPTNVPEVRVSITP